MNKVYSILKKNAEYLNYSIEPFDDSYKISYEGEEAVFVKEHPKNKEEWTLKTYYLEKQVSLAFNYAPVTFSVSEKNESIKNNEYYRLSFALFLNNGNPNFEKFILYNQAEDFREVKKDNFLDMYEDGKLTELEHTDNNFPEIFTHFIPSIRNIISNYIKNLMVLQNEAELKKKLKELEYLYYGRNSKELKIFGFDDENIKLMPDKIEKEYLEKKREIIESMTLKVQFRPISLGYIRTKKLLF